MEHLTEETFTKKVFNYKENKEWKFEGNNPCIIDFYADWCGPCQMVAPVLEELSEDYKGKLDIYKSRYRRPAGTSLYIWNSKHTIYSFCAC